MCMDSYYCMFTGALAIVMADPAWMFATDNYAYRYRDGHLQCSLLPLDDDRHWTNCGISTTLAISGEVKLFKE